MKYSLALLIGLSLSFHSPLDAQRSKVDSLEQLFAKSYGFEKLSIAYELMLEYHPYVEKETTKYLKLTTNLLEQQFQKNNILTERQLRQEAPMRNNVGIVQFELGQYEEAREQFNHAFSVAKQYNQFDEMTVAANYTGEIEHLAESNKKKGFGGFLKDKLNNLEIGQKMGAGIQEVSIAAAIKLAKQHETNGNYLKAITQYEKALNLLRNTGDAARIEAMQLQIAEVSVKAGAFDKAKLIIDQKTTRSKGNDSITNQKVAQIVGEINELAIQKEELVSNLSENAKEQLPTSRNYRLAGIDSLKGPDFIARAKEFEAKQDYKASLSYYKMYLNLQEELAEQEKQKLLDIQEKNFQIEQRTRQIELLKQDQQIKALEIENNEVELERRQLLGNALSAGVIMLFIFLAIVAVLYRSKKRDHQNLSVAYQHLDETKVELEQAEKRIKQLLQQQVSGDIANELMSSDDLSRNERKYVCVMFLDIRNFTPFAESLRPEEIIAYQNKVFGLMIDIIYKNKGVINQFMGDGFMATFGAPKSGGNDCQNAFLSANEILIALAEQVKKGYIPNTRVGIGLHSGWVVTGNVGTQERMQYSITGSTVITAARIEQLNKKYQSQLIISADVAANLSEKLNGTSVEIIERLKGQSEDIHLFKVV